MNTSRYLFLSNKHRFHRTMSAEHKEKQKTGIFFDLIKGIPSAVAPGVYAALLVALSMLLLAASIIFIQVSITGIFIDADGAVELITAFVFFAFVASVAAVVCHMVFLFIANTLGYGWTGILTGEPPALFKSKKENIDGFHQHLLVFIVFLTLGWLWFLEGKNSAYVQFSLNGMLLIFGSIFFGLIPLIPRLYFLFKPKGQKSARINKKEDKKEALYPNIYLILVVFGISFSLAMNEIKRHHQAQKDEIVMAYGETYTITRFNRKSKKSTVKLIIEPTRGGTVIFESYKCNVQFTDSEQKPVKLFNSKQLKEIGLASEGNTRVWAFDVKEKDRYIAEMKIDYCTAEYRIFKGENDE